MSSDPSVFKQDTGEMFFTWLLSVFTVNTFRHKCCLYCVFFMLITWKTICIFYHFFIACVILIKGAKQAEYFSIFLLHKLVFCVFLCVRVRFLVPIQVFQ